MISSWLHKTFPVSCVSAGLGATLKFEKGYETFPQPAGISDLLRHVNCKVKIDDFL